MKLISVNKNTEKYGFSAELEYDEPDFKGHQIGFIVCIKNDETGEVRNNFLNTPEQLDELMKDENIKLIEKHHTIHNEKTHKITPVTQYFMPYQVADHSMFAPTVVNANIDNCINTWFNVQIEVLFVDTEDNDYRRYINLSFKTDNVSVMSLVNDFFDDEEELERYFPWMPDDEEHEEGFAIDFYDNTGSRFPFRFRSGDALRDTITSVRLISLTKHVE